MINEQKVLAVIPARSGSKRCPGKNLKDFRGRPLLYWSIEAGKASKYIDKLVVSTDYMGIKWHAENIEIIDRPVKLADDNASNEDVLRHAWAQDTQYEWIVLLQPTSPLRTATDIDHCIEIADRNGTGCISYRQRNGTKNGAVYVAHADWLRHHDFTTPLPGVYLMPDETSADFDYAEEFELYE